MRMLMDSPNINGILSIKHPCPFVDEYGGAEMVDTIFFLNTEVNN